MGFPWERAEATASSVLGVDVQRRLRELGEAFRGKPELTAAAKDALCAVGNHVAGKYLEQIASESTNEMEGS